MSTLNLTQSDLPQDVLKIIEARHFDPFSVLGKHSLEDGSNQEIVRVFIPRARAVFLNNEINNEKSDQGIELQRIRETDLFQWQGPKGSIPDRYQIVWYDSNNQLHQMLDPYCFSPQISDYDIHLFGEGRHWHAYRFLGAHACTIEDIEGTLFATWAPNAERVSAVGDFNQWDGRCHPMRGLGGSGLWEIFIPGVDAGALYKFEDRKSVV